MYIIMYIYVVVKRFLKIFINNCINTDYRLSEIIDFMRFFSKSYEGTLTKEKGAVQTLGFDSSFLLYKFHVIFIKQCIDLYEESYKLRSCHELTKKRFTVI